MASYLIQHFDPIEPNWPKGGWSVYRITGDEIASRVVFEKVNPQGWYEGKVIARHSWCGYLGIKVTLPEVAELIAADSAKA